jgi:hypothetical protein
MCLVLYSPAFGMSHKFCYVVLSFSFSSTYYLVFLKTSSLAHRLFRIVLFSFQIFRDFSAVDFYFASMLVREYTPYYFNWGLCVCVCVCMFPRCGFISMACVFHPSTLLSVESSAFSGEFFCTWYIVGAFQIFQYANLSFNWYI